MKSLLLLAVLAPVAPALAVPINYTETWEGYSLGTADPGYNANWPAIPGQNVFPIIVAPAGLAGPAHPASNALEQGIGTVFGIENNLADGVEMPVGAYVEPTAASPLVVGIWWNPANGTNRQGNNFIFELLGGGAVQTGISTSRVAGGGDNNPYYFNGSSWSRQTLGRYQSQGWSHVYLTLTPAGGGGYDVSMTLTGQDGTNSASLPALTYSGGFDAIRIRALGTTTLRSWIDDPYITGGVIIPEPATGSLLALGGLVVLRRKRR